jgi:hypothetical protein
MKMKKKMKMKMRMMTTMMMMMNERGVSRRHDRCDQGQRSPDEPTGPREARTAGEIRGLVPSRMALR